MNEEMIIQNGISQEIYSILTTYKTTNNIGSAVFKIEKLLGRVYELGKKDRSYYVTEENRLI